jgi:Flp pilus assembly protein TadD/outer membrane protein OmpA-like peptidoglycan-associated protein
MKKQSVKGIALIAAASYLVSSCDLLKDLEYRVTPSPLEMHGDSVKVHVDVTFPPKGIRKKVSAEITPMLGDMALKTVTVQGEKVTGNGSVMNFKSGGTFSYEDLVAYKPEMEVTELKVTGKVFKGKKEKPGIFQDKKIADGTIITPYLVNKDYKVIMEKDQFTRVTEQTFMAQINYERAKSEVRPGELKDKDIVALTNWLKAAQTNPKIAIKAINITGYASPEGEENKNNTLSTDRAEAAKTATINLAKAVKNATAETVSFNLNGRGEDYEGFKKELQASKMNEDEKNLVIRVLEMHSDPVTRETEMRNMGKTFKYLDDNIFPKLRRAEISIVYDLTGYTDEELKTLSTTKPDSLKVEELLFAATLTNDLNTKLQIYTAAQNKYPEDARVHNNVGGVLYMQNKAADAKAHFEKANALADNAIHKNNLGACAGVAGDKAKAKQLFTQAKGAGNEVGYNMGILQIMAGKYPEAVSSFGGDASYNKALAEILNNAVDNALKTLDKSADKETAQGYYLKAIASARQNNVDATVSNLKNAFSKDASLKAKAAKDREFLKFAENATFSGAVK